ncbi:histidine kinase, partial [Herbaspirillum sp. HC18]
ADANQLENALLNLATNARDAMRDGGKLTFETANIHLDTAYSIAHSDVTPGEYVLIAVTDTGGGMQLEVAEKAFEPFFTTKPTGQGTGLGLPQVYGFLKQSGGHVKICNQPGRGLAVKLYLPRYVGSAKPAPAREELDAALPRAKTHALILVVEDEPEVLKVTTGILHELGYRTLSA